MKGQVEIYRQSGFSWAIRLLLGGVFIYAAISKMESPEDFAENIASYQIVPYPFINSCAFGIPSFEFFCGLLLVTGYCCRIGLLGILAMLIIFLGAILSSMLRGLPIHCGCFGGQPWFEGGPWISTARDIVLLVCAIHGYRHCLSGGAPVAASSDKGNRAPRFATPKLRSMCDRLSDSIRGLYARKLWRNS